MLVLFVNSVLHILYISKIYKTHTFPESQLLDIYQHTMALRPPPPYVDRTPTSVGLSFCVVSLSSVLIMLHTVGRCLETNT